MLDILITAILVAGSSGGVAWLLLRGKSEAAYQQGRAEVQLELAQLQGQWHSLNQQWQTLQQREQHAQDTLQNLHNQYTESQQKLASLASHLQRIPELETRLQAREAQLQSQQQLAAEQGARLAASEEQGRQLERLLQEHGQLQAQLTAMQQGKRPTASRQAAAANPAGARAAANHRKAGHAGQRARKPQPAIQSTGQRYPGRKKPALYRAKPAKPRPAAGTHGRTATSLWQAGARHLRQRQQRTPDAGARVAQAATAQYPAQPGRHRPDQCTHWQQ